MTKIKLPHSLVLVFGIIAFMAVLTWLVPAGEFERVEKEGRTMVVPDTYHRVEAQPQGIAALLSAPSRGFVNAASVVACIFIVGGAFGIVNATGAVDAAIKAFMRKVETTPALRTLTIPLLTTIFSLCGATFGMSEEVVAFVLIFIPFARALGYDSLIGVAIPLVGSGAGVAAAFINPFNVGIAQGIAELPPFSGLEYRLIVWVVVTGLTIFFLMRYAQKVRRNPQASLVYELDQTRETTAQQRHTLSDFSKPRQFVIACVLLSFVALIFGAIKYEWYITEINALFLFMGMIAGLAARMRVSQIAEAFVSGAKDMMTAGLMVAFSRGILIVATDGKIIDTILASLSTWAQQAHPLASAYFMFLVQSCIHFFVSSTSAQAALTMPIMAPLSDLLGFSRQTAVLVYQLGAGFDNMIIPTSGATMGVLGIAKIPFEKWLRWMLPLEALYFILAFILIAIPVLFGWGPH